MPGRDCLTLRHTRSGHYVGTYAAARSRTGERFRLCTDPVCRCNAPGTSPNTFCVHCLPLTISQIVSCRICSRTGLRGQAVGSDNLMLKPSIFVFPFSYHSFAVGTALKIQLTTVSRTSGGHLGHILRGRVWTDGRVSEGVAGKL